MKNFSFFIIACIFYANVIQTPILGHGFSGNTLVRMLNCWEPLYQIFEYSDEKIHQIASYNLKLNTYQISQVKSVGESQTNCYFEIGFDNNISDIICTASQKFYLPILGQWISAYMLKFGDQLLSANNKLKTITHIRFVKKQLKVYSLEIKNTHVFFVGSNCILTHNIAIPAAAIGFSMAFGEGAVAGGGAGSFFGPVGLFGGLLIGGAIGIGIKYICSQKKPQYYLKFDTNAIEQYRNSNFHTTLMEQNQANTLACFPPISQESNTLVHHADKAPGKPTENDGYTPPKGWDGKKRPHPTSGQYGWPDRDGSIWVPTGEGPLAHRGPHWDVIDRKGNHTNILPGGKRA